jgi:hypothetical protein
VITYTLSLGCEAGDGQNCLLVYWAFFVGKCLLGGSAFVWFLELNLRT